MIAYNEERLNANEYIEFLSRTDLGSQYPKVAVYLIANDKAISFYEKLGMKLSDDVMEYNKIEWTSFTVE